ncbi:GFA family protein [Hydrocarboniphaga effusa]|uniref:Glutathione-dependent formaldehyde-activating GFA n=1 Tax=Hydrocarboniphaga effusa AP103 TaxID=1172194 RepID=I8TD37_9GAMM|nr:GFA family protein [Hydrocarboniphaga effusa]EIT71598.1 glutathione-dependent formaldehyde-activating GFA [Hydrocarboniphaga effusa AP103]
MQAEDVVVLYQGSCHCGKIAFEVEGEIDQAMDCNCSHCSRKGYRLWFVPHTQLTLKTPVGDYATYRFNKHIIEHHFCSKCGCAPFASGRDREGNKMAGINLRCIENLDLSTVKTIQVDGRSF